MLSAGDKAPEFTLPDQQDKSVSLTDLRGKTVVLFFYPKADTPGCTVEACAFSEAKSDFDAKDAVLVGISPDTAKAQLKFADKYGLKTLLLADADHAVAEAYGVWAEKSMYGKKYMGVERTTFVIDPEGSIRHVFLKVKPEGHAAEVAALLAA